MKKHIVNLALLSLVGAFGIVGPAYGVTRDKDIGYMDDHNRPHVTEQAFRQGERWADALAEGYGNEYTCCGMSARADPDGERVAERGDDGRREVLAERTTNRNGFTRDLERVREAKAMRWRPNGQRLQDILVT